MRAFYLLHVWLRSQRNINLPRRRALKTKVKRFEQSEKPFARVWNDNGWQSRTTPALVCHCITSSDERSEDDSISLAIKVFTIKCKWENERWEIKDGSRFARVENHSTSVCLSQIQIKGLKENHLKFFCRVGSSNEELGVLLRVGIVFRNYALDIYLSYYCRGERSPGVTQLL